MSGFICSISSSFLFGSDTLVTDSEPIGSSEAGSDTFIDSSTVMAI